MRDVGVTSIVNAPNWADRDDAQLGGYWGRAAFRELVQNARATTSPVIAGLDPAIHPLRMKPYAKKMDPRVKPGGDDGGWGRAVDHLDRLSI